MQGLDEYLTRGPDEPDDDAEEVIDALRELTPDQRVYAFHAFCVHCGDDDPSCQCWNDE